jgi:hypothetical protein
VRALAGEDRCSAPLVRGYNEMYICPEPRERPK